MVGVARHWNSWDARDPLAMVHLPTGLTLRFAAFSNKQGEYRRLGVGDGVTLLEHESDGAFVRSRIAHAGSELELTWTKDGPHRLCARLRVLKTGEWGLRYWLALEVGFLELGSAPPPWHEDEPWIAVENAEPVPPGTAPRLSGCHRSFRLAVESRDPAVLAGVYDDIETFADDMRSRSYYAPPPRAARGRWGVLRFNAQMHPEIVIAAALGTDADMAARGAASVLAAVPALIDAAERAATTPPPAYQAVRDVIAWNTLWDSVNHRPTTVLTRNWLARKFSGWGVWLDDMLFHALLASLVGDWEIMRANLDAALDYQCPDGNMPCLRTGIQEWVDRSQSPIGGYILWRIFELTGDRALLAQHFPVLLRAHRWWLERRDGNGDGLIEYGSSPTGVGAFVHTKQAAMDESLMDNHPLFDDAGFDPATHTMTMAEPGLNSLVALDAQCLGRIASALGDHEAATALRDTADRLNRLISDRLWDPARGHFAGRHWTGDFVGPLSATCFYPLLSGAASEAQAESLIGRWLMRPESFWGERALPSSSFDDPASADDVYWRGRIWPPHLFLVWDGLRRQGRHDVATELCRRAWRMFEDGWRDRRVCRENYHRNDPAGDDSPDSDPYYSWGALIPAMRLLDAADRSPWHGLVLAPEADQPALLAEAGQVWRAERHGQHLHVTRNGRPLLGLTHAARLSLRGGAGTLAIAVVPAAGAHAVTLTLSGFAEPDLLACEVDGTAAHPTATDGHPALHLPHDRPSMIRLWHREGSDG